MNWHSIIPYDELRALYRKFRGALFQKERPQGEYVVVNSTVNALEMIFGREYFAPNWEFSYYKRGEDLNLSRIYYDSRTIDDKEYIWWQTHIRGWMHEDGTIWLKAHDELEPTEYDKEHIFGIGFNADKGLNDMRNVLDKADIDYTNKEWTRDNEQ